MRGRRAGRGRGRAPVARRPRPPGGWRPRAAGVGLGAGGARQPGEGEQALGGRAAAAARPDQDRERRCSAMSQQPTSPPSLPSSTSSLIGSATTTQTHDGDRSRVAAWAASCLTHDGSVRLRWPARRSTSSVGTSTGVSQETCRDSEPWSAARCSPSSCVRHAWGDPLQLRPRRGREPSERGRLHASRGPTRPSIHSTLRTAMPPVPIHPKPYWRGKPRCPPEDSSRRSSDPGHGCRHPHNRQIISAQALTRRADPRIRSSTI